MLRIISFKPNYNFTIMESYLVTIILIVITVLILSSLKRKHEKPITDKSLSNFWESTIHYPAWFKNNPNYVWSEIEEITENRKTGKIELTLKDKTTITLLSNSSKGYEGEECNDIEIYYNKEIKCAFRVSYDFNDMEKFQPFTSVEFIKTGRWQNKIHDFELWKIENDLKMDEKRKYQSNIKLKEKMNKRLE